jgi:hypothetical protein
VEEADGVFSLVVVERGEETGRRVADNLDELKYWVFEGVTFSMASDWELEHRVEGQDSRILLFEKQLELLGLLSARWPERYRREHRGVLREVGLY